MRYFCDNEDPLPDSYFGSFIRIAERVTWPAHNPGMVKQNMMEMYDEGFSVDEIWNYMNSVVL